MRKSIPSMKCPTTNGGCGKEDGFRVAVDRGSHRVIVDCQCGHRISLPLDTGALNSVSIYKSMVGAGILDETGEGVPS
jgi:hypothetical protein